MHKINLSLLSLILLLPSTSNAHLDEKGVLYENCVHYVSPQYKIEEAEEYKSWMCTAFLEGFLEAHEIFASKEDNHRFCIPKKSTTKQIASIYVKFLDDHSEYSNLKSSLVLTRSLEKAFPCVSVDKPKSSSAGVH